MFFVFLWVFLPSLFSYLAVRFLAGACFRDVIFTCVLLRHRYSPCPIKQGYSLPRRRMCSPAGSSFCLPARNAGGRQVPTEDTRGRHTEMAGHVRPTAETPRTTKRILLPGQTAPTALSAPCQQSACSPNAQTGATVPRRSAALPLPLP